MLLLHVSDIHFNHPTCTHPDTDPGRPFRTRLIQDARECVGELGSVDAILVSGDIAFKGLKEEYDAAWDWLRELATATGCPLERILVVPGNHDVNRKLCEEAPTRNAQTMIRNATSAAGRERELAAQFRHADTGRSLLVPISAYNDFAARFSCQLYAPERLFWIVELPIARGVRLRVHGLTSTIVSGFEGRDDGRDLYLSPMQTVLDPVDNTVNLAMAHHPPDWFIDNDDIEEALRGRAKLHLFGHKHRQRITRDPGFMAFAAGAVNPDRHEPGWQPGYNFVNLAVQERGGRVFLDVEAHLRAWEPPNTFRAMLSYPERDEVHRHSLQLTDVHLEPETVLVTPVAVRPIVPTPPVVAEEAVVAEELTRKQVLQFWDLTSSERRDICLRLELINPDDLRLPEAERYGRALKKAHDLDRLHEVVAETKRAMESRTR